MNFIRLVKAAMRPFSFVRKPYFEELQFLQRSFVNGARTGLLFEQERCFYEERDDFALAAAGQKTDCPASPGLGGIRLATMLVIANLANINRSRGAVWPQRRFRQDRVSAAKQAGVGLSGPRLPRCE